MAGLRHRGANYAGLARIIALLLVTLVAGACAAQSWAHVPSAVVAGRVFDEASGVPLVDAHVFIASSMIGAVTTADGRFQLRRVPAGAHTIYVSMLGYAPARIDTLIRDGRRYDLEIRLSQTVVEGPEVVVTAERDPAWYKRLDRFKRLFIGESPNADSCTIENPVVLSFDARWWGKLVAHAREPLVITNRALGYRVTYFLEEFEASGGTIRFDGEPLFEPLTPADSSEEARWRLARRRAYDGSFRHFMLSLLDGTYRDEGFRVHRRYDLDGGLEFGHRFGFDRRRVLEPGPVPDVTTLTFHGYIETVYVPEPADDAYLRSHYGTTWTHHRDQRSLIKLTDGPTTVDAQGEVLDPYGVTVYGYFAYERIGDLVPKEYRRER